MTEFDHNLDGLEQHIADLEREQERWEGGDAWFVGTAVEYSVYLEFGTSKMDPKPYFRPTLHEVEARGVPGFIRQHTATTVEEIGSIDELIRTLAFALERRIKEIITKKGLVDTGTLRASVLAVPTDPSKLPDADDLEFDENDMAVDARATFEVAA